MARPNHKHDFKFDAETADQAIFKCSHCDRKIGFWKPPVGDAPSNNPQATKDASGAWAIGEEHDVIGGTIERNVGMCDK